MAGGEAFLPEKVLVVGHKQEPARPAEDLPVRSVGSEARVLITLANPTKPGESDQPVRDIRADIVVEEDERRLPSASALHAKRVDAQRFMSRGGKGSHP